MSAVQTRNQLSRQALQMIPEWRATARFDEHVTRRQPYLWDQEDDDLVVLLSGSDSKSG